MDITCKYDVMNIHHAHCGLVNLDCEKQYRASVACSGYSYAPFIAKPKAACALRLGWAATSSSIGLCANMTSSIKPEVRNVTLCRQRKTEPWI